tara:strand:+ start:445 stop:1344 length:900 start_codon:yes stop_codon:yes gene_type:complete
MKFKPKSAFKLKSGNKPAFKMMGSSPVNHDTGSSHCHPKYNPDGSLTEEYKEKCREDFNQPHNRTTSDKSKPLDKDLIGKLKGTKDSPPLKQVVIDGKTYPKGYTKEDVKFLKEQREDVVRYEDLDEKGRAIWKKQGKPVPKDYVEAVNTNMGFDRVIKDKKEGKIIYKDGKKYWRAPDGTLHTGQVEDWKPESKKPPLKQEGPLPKENIDLLPGEMEGTWVYKGDDKQERIIDYDERAGFLEQNELQDSDWYLGGAKESDSDEVKKKAAIKGAKRRKQIEETIKKLDHEADILRNRKN